MYSNLHNTLNFIVCCVNYFGCCVNCFGHFYWLFTLHKQIFSFHVSNYKFWDFSNRCFNYKYISLDSYLKCWTSKEIWETYNRSTISSTCSLNQPPLFEWIRIRRTRFLHECVIYLLQLSILIRSAKEKERSFGDAEVHILCW